MREVKKTVRRETKTAAENAMSRHEKSMQAKGWVISHQSAGNSGTGWRCNTRFVKGV